MHQTVDIDLRDPSGAYRVVLIGALDEMTAAYVREKVRHIARATGTAVHQVEIAVLSTGDAGDVVLDVTLELATGRMQSRITARSVMAALDRFESQLRRLGSSESVRLRPAIRNRSGATRSAPRRHTADDLSESRPAR